jgi:hypothetical protein
MKLYFSFPSGALTKPSTNFCGIVPCIILGKLRLDRSPTVSRALSGRIVNLSRCVYVCGDRVQSAECYFGRYRLPTSAAAGGLSELDFNCPCDSLALSNPDNICQEGSLLPGTLQQLPSGLLAVRPGTLQQLPSGLLAAR